MSTGAKAATRRIVIASVAILLVLAASVAVSIWRYEHAIGQKDSARAARLNILQTQQAVTAFWHERESANEYLLVGTDDVLNEVTVQQGVFNNATEGLGRDAPAEAALVAHARAANEKFVAAFEDNRSVATDVGDAQKRVASLVVVSLMNTDEAAVLRPLAALEPFYTHETAVR